MAESFSTTTDDDCAAPWLRTSVGCLGTISAGAQVSNYRPTVDSRGDPRPDVSRWAVGCVLDWRNGQIAAL